MLQVPSTARQPRKWTIAEDQKLREEVEAQLIEGEVKDWCRIANAIPGRSNKDCRKRWKNALEGGLRKGQWSKSEDTQLARGVQRHGQRWVLVAEQIKTRSADQCAKRWQQSLDPDLDRSEWRETEDEILIQAVQKFGRHWKDIQRQCFPTRSKNCIKNRYTVLLRRYQNSGMPLPEFSGKSFPIAIDRRPSPYSTAEEDNASYASPGVFEDFLPPCTQVSTPETSWSLEEEPFTSWAPPVTMTSTVHPQAHIPDVSSPYGWSWPATTMGPAPIVSLEPVSTYPNVLNPATTSYESYPPMHSLHMYTHASNSSRSPAGQPRSSPTTLGAGPYQNQEAMVRSMDYRFQAPPSYHMQ